MTQKKYGRVSQPKYISLKPEVLSKAQDLEERLHTSLSGLVARLVVEAHSKLFGESLNTKLPQTHIQGQEPEQDPLS